MKKRTLRLAADDGDDLDRLAVGDFEKRQDWHVGDVRREQARQRAARDGRGDDGEAAALGQRRPGDLTDGVVIRQQSNDRRWHLPLNGKPAAYVQELATSELVPYMRGLEIEMVSHEAFWQRCQMHTFAYNIGDSAIELKWESQGEEKRATLPPESSCVILPYVSHAFTPSGADSESVEPLSDAWMFLFDQVGFA